MISDTFRTLNEIPVAFLVKLPVDSVLISFPDELPQQTGEAIDGFDG